MIDLIEIAPNGKFEGARLTDENNGTDVESLKWNGANSDDRGFILSMGKAMCEDNLEHRLLQMHPKWVNNGTIKAWLPWVNIGANPVFRASVGFLNGAVNTTGVTFQVWEHHEFEGREVWNRIIKFKKNYTGELIEIEADLTHLRNHSVGIELRVDAGESAGQDWAVWVNPRIEDREGQSGATWKINPNRLTVNNPDDNWTKGSGDEPYMGGIYFRSIFGKHGSTKTVALTKLQSLGSDVEKNESVTIEENDDLSLVDCAVSYSNLLEAAINGIQLMGYIFIPVDADNGGKGIVRSEIKKKEELLNQALINVVESNPTGYTDFNSIFEQLLQAMDPSSETVVLSGGGNLFGDLWDSITSNFGDDLIGTSILLMAGIDPVVLDDLMNSQEIELPENVVISGIGNKDLSIEVKGDGSRYTIDVNISSLTNVGVMTN